MKKKLTMQDLRDSLEIKRNKPDIYTGVTGLEIKDYVPHKDKLEEIDTIIEKSIEQIRPNYYRVNYLYFRFFSTISKFKLYTNFDYENEILGEVNNLDTSKEVTEEEIELINKDIENKIFELYDLIEELDIFNEGYFRTHSMDYFKFVHLLGEAYERHNNTLESTALQLNLTNELLQEILKGNKEKEKENKSDKKAKTTKKTRK